jgi:hypothetical protein
MLFAKPARVFAGLIGLPLMTTIPGLAQTPTGAADQRANSRLLAAAEPFENLTEQAFAASSAKLQNLVSKAEKAAQDVRAALAADDQSALDQQLSAIKEAEKAKNPSQLALAAVEGYRILVSSAQGTKVPTAVGLLDYAGFRYNADLRSNPIHWADMQAAVAFAQEQWSSISPQVSQPSLQKSLSSALAHMDQAVTQKSAKEAASSVKDEQDLVDKLEAYFNRR